MPDNPHYVNLAVKRAGKRIEQNLGKRGWVLGRLVVCGDVAGVLGFVLFAF